MSNNTVAPGAFSIRISKEGYRSDDEVKAQVQRYIEQCKRYCERKRLPVPTDANIFVESDVSGGLALDERKLGMIIERIEAGELGWCMSPDVDRFGRDTFYGTLAWRRAVGAGGRLLFADEDIDSADTEYGDPQKEFERALVDGSAYRRKTARRFDWSVKDAIRKGIHSGSVPPMGYRWPGVEIPLGNGKTKFKKTGPLAVTGEINGATFDVSDEAARVKAGFAAAAAGASIAEIKHALGVRSQGHAADIVRNDVYVGVASSGGYVNDNSVGRGDLAGDRCCPTHEPIISRELFDEVQRRLAVRKALAHASPNKRRSTSDWATLANGVLRCPHCFGRLTPSAPSDPNVRATYRHLTINCKATKPAGVGINHSDDLVALVTEKALEYHAEHREIYALGAVADDAQIRVYEEELFDLTQRLAKVTEQYENDEIDEDAFGPMSTKLRKKIAEARLSLEQARANGGFLAMDTDEVRALIASDHGQHKHFLQETIRVVVQPVGRGRRPPGWSILDRLQFEPVITDGMTLAHAEGTPVYNRLVTLLSREG